ncbi:MAG TPA: GxxExxY protein [Gemmatimonadaceae bacterium]|nr:GxxExxY protein [Gemmatimonadaceae bacterium]
MPLQNGDELLEEALSRSAIGAFYAVYRKLGFGFLESIYVLGLERELTRRGHAVGREVAVPVYYDGEILAYQRMDLVVDGRLVLEVKATEFLHKDAPRQLLNYLRSTDLQVGLVLHFGREPKFHRVIYDKSFKQRRVRQVRPDPSNP